MAPYRVGQSDKNTDQRGETFLLAEPGTQLQEPVFLRCIINARSGEFCLFTKALSGKACCHLTCHGGFYFLLKNGDSKVPIQIAIYLIT